MSWSPPSCTAAAPTTQCWKDIGINDWVTMHAPSQFSVAWYGFIHDPDAPNSCGPFPPITHNEYYQFSCNKSSKTCAFVQSGAVALKNDTLVFEETDAFDSCPSDLPDYRPPGNQCGSVACVDIQ